MKEEWRAVIGWEDLYKVSNMGRVARIWTNKRGTTIRLLKPWIAGKGYLHVELWRNSKRRKRYIHQLVVEAFIGPYSREYEPHHKNGDKADCRLTNLEVLTKKEHNELHARDMRGTSNFSLWGA
jgi:hypothetical protein